MALPVTYIPPDPATRLANDARLPADLRAFWGFVPTLQAYVNDLPNTTDIAATLTAYYSKTASDARYALIGAVASGTGTSTGIVTVESFKKPGLTDDQAWSDAIDWMGANRQPLYQFRPLDLHLTKTKIYTGGYLNIQGYGTLNFRGMTNGVQTMLPGRVTAASPDILTWPSTTNPGPLAGAALMTTQVIYDSRFEWGVASDMRYVLACYDALNFPTISGKISFCDTAVVTYSGSQLYQFIGCGASDFCCFYLGSFVCNPAGSPRAGIDDSYTDDFRFSSAPGGYHGSFGGARVNADFDRFIQNSFLRLGQLSVNQANVGVPYADRNGVAYTATSIEACPSGRIFYVAMRQGRDCGGFQLGDLGTLEIRGKLDRGIGLVNGLVRTVMLGRIIWEATGVFPVVPGLGLLQVGSFDKAFGGTMNRTAINLEPEIAGGFPLFSYTYVGNQGATAEEALQRPRWLRELNNAPTLDLATGRLLDTMCEPLTGALGPRTGWSTSSRLLIPAGTAFRATSELYAVTFFNLAGNRTGVWHANTGDGKIYDYFSVAPAGTVSMQVSTDTLSYNKLKVYYSLANFTPFLAAELPTARAAYAGLSQRDILLRLIANATA